MQFLRPARSADVTLQHVGNEAILYDRRHGRAHVINDGAARIWKLCDGRASLDEVVTSFAASYSIPPSAVRADVVDMVTTFRELHVLDEEGTAAG